MIAVRAQQVKPTPKIGVAFAAIPLDVLRSRNLSPAARLAFAALANHARMKRGEISTLTNRRLAEGAGLSIAAARRALDELEAAGLVRRLFGPSKRIRVGVAVTYQPTGEGCSQPATSPKGVAQVAPLGCSPRSPKGCAPVASDLVRRQEEIQESVSLPTQETEDNPEDAALFAQLGPAGYLRMMVAKGKQTAAPKPATPPPAPSTVRPSQNALRITLDGMVGQLGEALSLDDLRPSRRRRR